MLNQSNLLDSIGVPTHIVMVHWEPLADTPMETGDTKSECAMFHTSIAEMAARVVASRLVVPFVAVILEPDSRHWR